MRRGTRKQTGRAILVLALLFLGCPALFAQTLDVQESSGYVEALLPSVGWRQAVVGRQMTSGSVLTAWLDASARLDFQGNTLSVGSLSRVLVRSIQPDLVQLSVTAGSVSVTADTAAFEVEYRGFLIRVDKGAMSVKDGILKSESGTVTLSEQGQLARAIAPGGSVNLLSRKTGPVFSASSQ